MNEIMEQVKLTITKGVSPWAIRKRGLNPKYQRTVCPFCQGQFVEWAGHYATCEALEVVTHAVTATMSKWQDIMTAPKDGTNILFYTPNYGVWYGHYDPAPRGYSLSYPCADAVNITHWMPLPRPPENST